MNEERLNKQVPSEEELLRRSKELEERMKELNCVYDVSNILENPDLTFDEAIQAIAERIPHAWQFSEIACANIVVGDRSFSTEHYKKTSWCQEHPIKIKGEKIGDVTVCYLEECSSNEDIFLKEIENQLNKKTVVDIR